MQPQQTNVSQAYAALAAGQAAEGLLVLNRLAAQRDPEGLFALFDIYWRGVGGIRIDYRRGRELLRQASDAGHPIAMRGYTNLLASGIAGKANWPEAMRRLREEARVDARRAQMLSLIEKMELTETGGPQRIPETRLVLDSPEVVSCPKLFTPEECAFMILVAEPTYEPSLVLDEKIGEYRDPIRTSDGAVMHWLIEDPVVHALNRRIAAASGTDYDQGEPLLILRYRPGQEYKKHLDALPGLENQRIKTALVYLNDQFEGGETAFVRAEKKMRGGTGDAIIFRNIGPDGRPDQMSQHAGLPVTSGTKYLASRWIRKGRHLEW